MEETGTLTRQATQSIVNTRRTCTLSHSYPSLTVPVRLAGDLPEDWVVPPASVLAVSADGGDLHVVPVQIMIDFASIRIKVILSKS